MNLILSLLLFVSSLTIVSSDISQIQCHKTGEILPDDSSWVQIYCGDLMAEGCWDPALPVIGSGPYHETSSLCMAARHAGRAAGLIVVRRINGFQTFRGSYRNGVVAQGGPPSETAFEFPVSFPFWTYDSANRVVWPLTPMIVVRTQTNPSFYMTIRSKEEKSTFTVPDTVSLNLLYYGVHFLGRTFRVSEILDSLSPRSLVVETSRSFGFNSFMAASLGHKAIVYEFVPQDQEPMRSTMILNRFEYVVAISAEICTYKSDNFTIDSEGQQYLATGIRLDETIKVEVGLLVLDKNVYGAFVGAMGLFEAKQIKHAVIGLATLDAEEIQKIYESLTQYGYTTFLLDRDVTGMIVPLDPTEQYTIETLRSHDFYTKIVPQEPVFLNNYVL